MTFTSLAFLGFVILASLIALPLRGTPRTFALFVASLVFVGSYLAEPPAIVPLAGFIAVG